MAWRLSLNRTNSKSARAPKAADHRRTSKTLARWLRGPEIRQVLDCAAAAALWICYEVHAPNACEQTKEGSP